MALKKKLAHCCYLQEVREFRKQRATDATAKRGKKKKKKKGNKAQKEREIARELANIKKKYDRYLAKEKPKGVPKGVKFKQYDAIPTKTYELFGVPHTYKCILMTSSVRTSFLARGAPFFVSGAHATETF